MSAADGLGVRVAAAASWTARAGADSHAETTSDGGGASGFLDVLADLAEPKRDFSQEPAAPAAAAAAVGLLEATLRQLASAAEAAAGPSRPVPDRQAPAADQGPLTLLSPSLAEVAAVLSAPLPRQAPVPADAGLIARVADATLLAGPHAGRDARMPEAHQDAKIEPVATSATERAAAPASDVRVVERATHLAPATGARAALQQVTTPTARLETAAGVQAPTPAAAADEEARPARGRRQRGGHAGEGGKAAVLAARGRCRHQPPALSPAPTAKRARAADPCRCHRRRGRGQKLCQRRTPAAAGCDGSFRSWRGAGGGGGARAGFAAASAGPAYRRGGGARRGRRGQRGRP
jgi:hypothetical protein